MPSSPPIDMPPEEFRRCGHEIVDRLADFLANIREYPVLPHLEPGQLSDALPRSGPEHGEPMAAILSDFRETILPAVTHWNHPRFFAYYPSSGSGPGILAEMIAAALNANGMIWKSSPAGTELETTALGWLRQWLGLPDEFFGIIYDTASVSTLHAIAAAREIADPDARTRGARSGLVLYTSEHAHSSVEKDAIALGIGQRNVRKVAVDWEFRMRADELERVVRDDVHAGLRPFCVIPTIGTTSSSSIDPVPDVVRIARQHDMWVHVDASYAGVAAIVPELKHIFDGVAQADSVVVNPHKWLFTPADISAFYTRHPDVLRRAFSLVPEYLRTSEDDRAINYMDFGVQLGRRFRSLKLWFVLRYFGREGIVNLLRSHMDYARRLTELIERDTEFELAAPVPFSLVCFRHRESDERSREIMDRVNRSGRAFLSHTVLNGRFTLRIAIGNVKTTWEDVQEAWRAVKLASAESAVK